MILEKIVDDLQRLSYNNLTGGAKLKIYRIWLRGPKCPHCSSGMRSYIGFGFRCLHCNSFFRIDDEAMNSEDLLGSEEIFCRETYRGTAS